MLAYSYMIVVTKVQYMSLRIYFNKFVKGEEKILKQS